MSDPKVNAKTAFAAILDFVDSTLKLDLEQKNHHPAWAGQVLYRTFEN